MFFVAGRPGFQQYINVLAGVGTVVCVCMTIFFLTQLRRNPRDIARRALATAFALETVAVILNNPVLDRAAAARLGSPNIVELFGAATGGVGSSTALVIALSAWQDPPEKHQKTTRHWLVAAGLVLAVMLVLWLTPLLPQSMVPMFAHEGDHHLLSKSASIHDLFLFWSALKIWSLCRRNTGSGQMGWTARGLRLVWRGTTLQLCILPMVLGMSALNALFGTKLAHSEVFVIPLGVVGTLLVVIGLCLPAAGPLWDSARQRRSDERAYRDLAPLWEGLAGDNSDVALSREPGHDIGYLLYRRVVEIRDGLARLAPHITHPSNNNAQPAAQAAEQVHRALAAKQTDDGTDKPDGFARLSGDNPEADLQTETNWLRQTAKHYARIQSVPARALP